MWVPVAVRLACKLLYVSLLLLLLIKTTRAVVYMWGLLCASRSSRDISSLKAHSVPKAKSSYQQILFYSHAKFPTFPEVLCKLCFLSTVIWFWWVELKWGQRGPVSCLSLKPSLKGDNRRRTVMITAKRLTRDLVIQLRHNLYCWVEAQRPAISRYKHTAMHMSKIVGFSHPPHLLSQCFSEHPKIRGGNRISQGDFNRGAEGVEGSWEWGRGIPLPIRLGGLGERRKLPQRGPGRDPDENDFSAFKASQNASGCTARDQLTSCRRCLLKGKSTWNSL